MPLPTPRVKRLRVFAGPNGSGKSTIAQAVVERVPGGAFINADELQRRLALSAGVPLPSFLASLNSDDFTAFYNGHPLRAGEEPFPFVARQDGRLTFSETCLQAAKRASATAVLADYLLARLVEAGEELAFEAVASHPSEVALMRQAREAGYRVTLYFVGVVSPEICKQRVALRVTQGGGLGVPDAEVVAQYERSLASLKEAVALSDRAYLFDNTYSGASLKLEIREAAEVLAHEPALPAWITCSLPALVPQ
jgi:predicted ABC-type ATPase